MKIKPFKILYGLLIVCFVIIILLLVISVLPVTGNFKILTVLSGSMEPTIHTGGIIAIKSMPTYQVDEIITFSRDNKTKIPVTHRIVDIKFENSKPIYITKGDANNNSDGQEIQINEIWGKMIFTLPYLGYAVNFTKQPIGFMLIVVIPSVIIIYDEIQKIKNEILNIKKKKISKTAKPDDNNEKPKEE